MWIWKQQPFLHVCFHVHCVHVHYYGRASGSASTTRFNDFRTMREESAGRTRERNSWSRRTVAFRKKGASLALSITKQELAERGSSALLGDILVLPSRCDNMSNNPAQHPAGSSLPLTSDAVNYMVYRYLQESGAHTFDIKDLNAACLRNTNSCQCMPVSV